MKKCKKCGKQSEGNFCVFCGGELIEEIKVEEKKIENTENKENKKPNVRTKKNRVNIFMITTIILAIILCGLGIWFYSEYSTIEEKDKKISSLEKSKKTLETENKNLKNENSNLTIENVKNKTKLNFFDEYIVFVIDGYGNYYYTYDQMKQVTQGTTYTFWAYNIEQAIDRGYRAWK